MACKQIIIKFIWLCVDRSVDAGNVAHDNLCLLLHYCLFEIIYFRFKQSFNNLNS